MRSRSKAVLGAKQSTIVDVQDSFWDNLKSQFADLDFKSPPDFNVELYCEQLNLIGL